MAVPDPKCPKRRLGDNTVIALVGDNPQDSVSRRWADTSLPNGLQARMWLMSNGFVRTGAFGGARPSYQGEIATSGLTYGAGEGGLYNLDSGDMLPFDRGSHRINGVDLRTVYGEVAAAAALYAVVRGRMSRVVPYYAGPDFPVLRAPAPPH